MDSDIVRHGSPSPAKPSANLFYNRIMVLNDNK